MFKEVLAELKHLTLFAKKWPIVNIRICGLTPVFALGPSENVSKL